MPQRGRRNVDSLLIMALACGATLENAAANVGVSKATAFRRSQEPEFQQELRKTKAEMVARTASMLTAAAGEAVKTLLALQKDPTPPASRLGAARAILELGKRTRESAEFGERIAVLEARVAETPPPSEQPRPAYAFCPPAEETGKDHRPLEATSDQKPQIERTDEEEAVQNHTV